MSETNPRRSRKSKLVPREDSDNLQEPKRKVSKRSQIDENTPSTSSYQPLQFDIKIEVEECDEDQFDTLTDFASNTEIKTEITNENDLFEVEEHAINSFLEQALNKNKEELKKKNDEEKSTRNKIAFQNDHDYSQFDVAIEGNPIPAVNHLRIHEDALLNTLDELFKGKMSPIDKMLGIEMRNFLGRCRVVKHNPSLAEIKIQMALCGEINRKVPFCYKCYICNMAWWHLMPFKDHMNGHKESYRVTSELEFRHLYNLTAHPARGRGSYRKIQVKERCWRCSNDFEHHRGTYFCVYCSMYFDTCLKFKFHEGECVKLLMNFVKKGPLVVFTCHICKLKVVRKEDLEKHYEDFHAVRSDFPMDDVVHTCTTCSEPYASMKFHYCPKKNHTAVCTHCRRKFPSYNALNIHLERQTGYRCPACDYHMPLKCMMTEHFLKHSANFNMLYKCLACEDDNGVLLLRHDLVSMHRSGWHKNGDNTKKKFKYKTVFAKVLVPSKLLGAQKNKDDPKTATDSPNPPMKLPVEVNSTIVKEDTNVVEEPSETIDKEFEELNDSILDQTMVEQIKKNNLPDEEEGYEYTLSSIFNPNDSDFDTEIDEESNVIDKLIVSSENKTKKKSTASVKDVTVTSNDERNDEKVELPVGAKTKMKEKPEQKSTATVKDVSVTSSDETNNEHIELTVGDKTETEEEPKQKPIATVKDVTVTSNDENVELTVGVKTKTEEEPKQKPTDTVEDVTVTSSDDTNDEKVELTVGDKTKQKEPTVTKEESVQSGNDQLSGDAGFVYAQEITDMLAALVENRSPVDRRCITCDHLFDRRMAWKRHYIVHLLTHARAQISKRLYNVLRCQLCFATYVDADEYKQHMRQHANLPVYKCELCPKTFSESRNCIKHMRTHKEFICQKMLPSDTPLEQHMEEVIMPRVSRSKSQLSDDEKKKRLRERKKLSMRRSRAKMDEAAIAEVRRKDRERYIKKKEKGQVKKIEQYTPKEQRQLRKLWREKSQKRRDVLKMRKEQIL